MCGLMFGFADDTLKGTYSLSDGLTITYSSLRFLLGLDSMLQVDDELDRLLLGRLGLGPSLGSNSSRLGEGCWLVVEDGFFLVSFEGFSASISSSLSVVVHDNVLILMSLLPKRYSYIIKAKFV